MRAALVCLSLGVAATPALAGEDKRDQASIAPHSSPLSGLSLPSTTPSPTLEDPQPSGLDILTFPTAENDLEKRAGLVMASEASDLASASATEAPAFQPMERDFASSGSTPQAHKRVPATQAIQATQAVDSTGTGLFERAETQCTHAPPQDYRKNPDNAYKKTSNDGDYWIMSGEEGNKNAVDSGASITSATIFALALTLVVAGFLV